MYIIYVLFRDTLNFHEYSQLPLRDQLNYFVRHTIKNISGVSKYQIEIPCS